VLARRPPPLGARAFRPRMARSASGAAQVVGLSKIDSYPFSPNAVLAAALTLQKRKARSACAVRASDGRRALTRCSSPGRRHQNWVVLVAYACASGRAL
jgi:hypothetical protein